MRSTNYRTVGNNSRAETSILNINGNLHFQLDHAGTVEWATIAVAVDPIALKLSDVLFFLF